VRRAPAAFKRALEDFMTFEVLPDPDTPKIVGDGVEFDGYRTATGQTVTEEVEVDDEAETVAPATTDAQAEAPSMVKVPEPAT
jgi:hypothetical protein